jgi:class 3 adenylate cyclase
MLIFFGDPETKGDVADAQACLKMAWEMQRRLTELNAKWRHAGIEEPFQVRMGINSGFCNVGNFGSNDRMDYTIIGAEANLAARLQSIAQPGQIVISYETYALVRGDVVAHELTPITMKGISRQVVPYAVDRVLDEASGKRDIVVERMAGLDLYFNPGAVAPADAERVKSILADAMASLEAGQAKPA